MAALYPGTSVSGYNSNPPPDDGSTGSNNLITWAMPKTKLGDPLNTFATNVDSNITAAFGKTIDGAGIVSTGISYQVVAADQGKLIKATASGITITAPVTAVGAPFVFGVSNQSSGTITVAGTSPQNIDGAATQLIQAGGGCLLHFDGTNWFSFGLQAAQPSVSGSNHGFDMPVNLGLTASNNGTVLTIAVKTKAGNDPSAGDPVLIPFRDVTIANGDPVWVTLTGALSINTNAAGATLGTANTVPFRIWVVAFNNGGSVVLGLYQTVTGGASPTAIAALNETAVASSTGISAAATSAGVFYTPNGTTLSNKAFRIIGWFEYASGLTTAGTYASNPTTLQLFGPGCKKPGDVLQIVTGSNTTQATTTSATYVQLTSAPAPTITPTSAASIIELELSSAVQGGAGNGSVTWSRGTSANTNLIGSSPFVAATNQVGLHLRAFDAPGTTSSQTYTIQGKVASGTIGVNNQTVTATQFWTLKEIMA